MAKEVKWIYQDCPMCGARKEWGEQQLKVAYKHGLKIVKTPFFSEGAEGLMWKAIEAGISNYPFFTDGEKFSKDINDFVEKPKARKKKSKKVKKEEDNGSISED